MTPPASSVKKAAEPQPDSVVVPLVPVIESEPDSELFPFDLAYRKNGRRVVERLHGREDPPFAIFQVLGELEAASKRGLPEQINEAARRVILVGMPETDAKRLLELIEGSEEQVGIVTPAAIGGVVDQIRLHAYGRAAPTQPGSSNGRRGTGRTSSAGKSAKKSASKRSRPTRR